MENRSIERKQFSLLRKVVGPFAARPRLTSGMSLGLLAFFLLFYSGVNLEASSLAIICWDFTCIWFITLTLLHMQGQNQESLKAQVAEQDEGQGIIVTVVMIAVAASLYAVALELTLAKSVAGLGKDLRVALALITVGLSWFATHLVFALHYAHEYYAPDKTTSDGEDIIGGLKFPGDEEPDHWDFLHFATVIGVASQTADIAFSNRRMRRIGTVHGILSFSFNTAVLALTINLLAGLF